MRITMERVMENATDEQKTELMQLIVAYQNAYGELVATENLFKRERKDIQHRMEATMAGIMELLQLIESGQQSLFGGGEDEP